MKKPLLVLDLINYLVDKEEVNRGDIMLLLPDSSHKGICNAALSALLIREPSPLNVRNEHE